MFGCLRPARECDGIYNGEFTRRTRLGHFQTDILGESTVAVRFLDCRDNQMQRGEQEKVMTSVAMASRHSSGAPSTRAKTRAEAQLVPRSHSALPSLVVDDEDLDDLRTAPGIGLGLVLGLGSWIVVGFVAWQLLA